MGPDELEAKQREPQRDPAARLASIEAQMEALIVRVSRLEEARSEKRARTEPSQKDMTAASQAATPMRAEVTEPALPPPMPSFSAKAEPKASVSLENRLGAQVFSRVGILTLLVGAAYGLKLAVDNHLIGPLGRVVIGLLAGAALVLWSERFRRKGFAGFSYALKAIGSGVLYLSLWAAFQLYHLLDANVALVGMVLVTAWNAYMAWAQDAELLAGYAIAGGLSTPLLLSSGGNHEVFLFCYLLAIDAATVVLVRLKPWSRLLLGAFPLTVAYFIGWYAQFYAEPAFAVTVAFVILFFAVFASVPLWQGDGDTAKKRHGITITEILLPLGDAAFVSLALYSVMQDSERHWFLPWLMVILAAAYLLLMRLPQSALAAAMHLSIAVVFLTIAIPLKASGHWITVAWLVEGLALGWVASRNAENTASKVLRILSAGTFVLGLCGLIVTGSWFNANGSTASLRDDTGAALAGAAMLGAAAWLALRASKEEQAQGSIWLRYAGGCLLAMDLTGLLLCLREALAGFGSSAPHPAFFNGEFAAALAGLAVLCGSAWAALRISREESASETTFWHALAAGTVVLVNLLAVLTGVREIGALWQTPLSTHESQLQQALAISAFLMLYGVALLAAGFWRRSAFIRWQALVLLIFTIGKTFLYDTRNLSQGYRVASFLILGAILMAVSFAYQKDWLALRDTAHRDELSHQPNETGQGR